MFVALPSSTGELFHRLRYENVDTPTRKPLSFHAVSFGQDASNSSLRRMAQLALEIQNHAPNDPLLPTAANIPSSFNTALNTASARAYFTGKY